MRRCAHLSTRCTSSRDLTSTSASILGAAPAAKFVNTLHSKRKAIRCPLAADTTDKSDGALLAEISTKIEDVQICRASTAQASKTSAEIDAVLAEVGPRLKRVRTKRGVTLTELAEETGISKSTLSRLGRRQHSLRFAHYSGEGELVSITSGSSPRVTCTLRALDCSATGIVIVSTPWS